VNSAGAAPAALAAAARHSWTTGEEQLLQNMVAQGATWGEIAQVIGCTADAARSREWAVRRRREEVG
jgi:hypothetical protein